PSAARRTCSRAWARPSAEGSAAGIATSTRTLGAARDVRQRAQARVGVGLLADPAGREQRADGLSLDLEAERPPVLEHELAAEPLRLLEDAVIRRPGHDHDRELPRPNLDLARLVAVDQAVQIRGRGRALADEG